MKSLSLPVKFGNSTLPSMTAAQAKRHAERNFLRVDLKRAGFNVSVFESDPEINGAHFFRICIGKTVKAA